MYWLRLLSSWVHYDPRVHYNNSTAFIINGTHGIRGTRSLSKIVDTNYMSIATVWDRTGEGGILTLKGEGVIFPERQSKLFWKLMGGHRTQWQLDPRPPPPLSLKKAPPQKQRKKKGRKKLSLVFMDMNWWVFWGHTTCYKKTSLHEKWIFMFFMAA